MAALAVPASAGGQYGRGGDRFADADQYGNRTYADAVYRRPEADGGAAESSRRQHGQMNCVLIGLAVVAVLEGDGFLSGS